MSWIVVHRPRSIIYKYGASDITYIELHRNLRLIRTLRFNEEHVYCQTGAYNPSASRATRIYSRHNYYDELLTATELLDIYNNYKAEKENLINKGWRRQRDSQRQRVYDWENRYFSTDTEMKEFLSEEEAHDWLSFIWADLDLSFKKPRLVYSDRHRRRAFYRGPSPGTLHFPKSDDWLRRRWVFIHELAHSLHSQINDKEAAHGPAYCGIYAELIGYATNQPVDKIIDNMKESGRLKVTQWRGK